MECRNAGIQTGGCADRPVVRGSILQPARSTGYQQIERRAEGGTQDYPGSAPQHGMPDVEAVKVTKGIYISML